MREKSSSHMITTLHGKLSSSFLDSRIFLFVLDKELARAERYNHFASILLFKLEAVQKLKQGFSLNRLAQALANNVRKPDYLGSVAEGTLGIILLHAGIGSARRVLERLRPEALFYLSGGPQELKLKASYAVYPSEANSSGPLYDLALKRLG